MPRKLTDTARAELKALLQSDRYSNVELAERFGISAPYVSIMKADLRAAARYAAGEPSLVRNTDGQYFGPVPHRDVPEPNVIAGISKAQLMSGRARPARRTLSP